MNNTARNCLQATIKKIDGAYAPNTIRAYKSNFESFINYCDETNEKAFPEKHETVVSFIKTISDGRLKSSSIKMQWPQFRQSIDLIQKKIRRNMRMSKLKCGECIESLQDLLNRLMASINPSSKK